VCPGIDLLNFCKHADFDRALRSAYGDTIYLLVIEDRNIKGLGYFISIETAAFVNTIFTWPKYEVFLAPIESMRRSMKKGVFNTSISHNPMYHRFLSIYDYF
jgi:hypothetical protein